MTKDKTPPFLIWGLRPDSRLSRNLEFLKCVRINIPIRLSGIRPAHLMIRPTATNSFSSLNTRWAHLLTLTKLGIWIYKSQGLITSNRGCIFINGTVLKGCLSGWFLSLVLRVLILRLKDTANGFDIEEILCIETNCEVFKNTADFWTRLRSIAPRSQAQ